MTVPTVNIVIEKGTNFSATFDVKNSDDSVFSLTNQSATAKIRKHPTATSSKSFSTTITTATGKIAISMGSTITSDLTEGRNYYDVILTHATTGNVTKIFQGMAMVNNTVSL